MTRQDIKEGAVFQTRHYGLVLIAEVVVEEMSAMCFFLETGAGLQHLWLYEAPTTQYNAMCLDDLTLVTEGS